MKEAIVVCDICNSELQSRSSMAHLTIQNHLKEKHPNGYKELYPDAKWDNGK